MKNIAKQREFGYVICFLKGFNDVYNAVKTKILIMEQLSSVSCFFSLFLHQERQFIGGIIFDTANAQSH